MKHLRRVTNCKSDTTSALQCDLLIFLWPCSNCAPTREKAYVAWTPSNKSPGQGVAGREKSLLQTPSLSLDSYRNMSLPSPRACVTLSLILKVFICGWQFHVPVGRGNNYRKELIFDQGGGIGWWSGCDRNLGRKLLSYIYMLFSFLWQSIPYSLSQHPQKHMGICQGIFPDLSFEKLETWLSNCIHFISQCYY